MRVETVQQAVGAGGPRISNRRRSSGGTGKVKAKSKDAGKGKGRAARDGKQQTLDSQLPDHALRARCGRYHIYIAITVLFVSMCTCVDIRYRFALRLRALVLVDARELSRTVASPVILSAPRCCRLSTDQSILSLYDTPRAYTPDAVPERQLRAYAGSWRPPPQPAGCFGASTWPGLTCTPRCALLCTVCRVLCAK